MADRNNCRARRLPHTNPKRKRGRAGLASLALRVGIRARRNARSAFTLLEVLLTLALTTVTVFLIGAAIHVNLNVVDKSRNQVEEAQLARALLQRIADDIRNAVPYQPPLGSSSGSSSTSSSGGSATAATQAAVAGSSGTNSTASSDTSSSSGTMSGNTSMPVSGGLFGDTQSVRVETAHRPRLTQAMLAATADGSQPAMLSDLRIVSYSLSSPDGSSAPTADGAATGLYRSEMDRSLYYAAMQQGQSNPGDTQRIGDPTVGEIENLQFTYYDGSTPNDTWDSVQQGKLPSAVRVTLTLRSARKVSAAASLGNVGFGGAAGDQRIAVYEILVDLPNSAVTSSEIQGLNQVDSSGGGGMGGGGAMGGGGGGAMNTSGSGGG
jgi:hypothetical protein